MDGKSDNVEKTENTALAGDKTSAVGPEMKMPSAPEPMNPSEKTADESDKKEDALETIKEIKAERKPVKKKPVWLTVLSVIFFPVTAIVLAFKWFTRKIKLSVTAKTTIVFALVFGALITIYVVILISSVETEMTAAAMEGAKKYLFRLKWTSAILVVVFVALGAALGNIASHYMMEPLRRMIKQIDEIGSEDLSKRLSVVDSQDELTELTKQINEMLDEIEDTFERQSNFISDASHELKTPISVIQGYANMLKRWGKTDPALLDESIDTLLSEAENMKRIVQQLLLLAKIGNLTMEKTKFDMVEVLREVVEQYSLTDHGKTLEFVGSEEIFVETDKNMLIESVRSLVDNAIKYTGDGGRITVECKRDDEGAQITVSDNGIGIAPEHLPHIFERFYRCDKTRSRANGSSGLGLTITKSIVEMMGGKISVQSRLKEGSTFTIQLY